MLFSQFKWKWSTSYYDVIVVLNILMVITCAVGDVILTNSTNQIVKVASDNLCHGLVAVLSWTLVVTYLHEYNSLFSFRFNDVVLVICCGALACAIDFDHFIAVRSFDLKKAAHLGKRRPFLHCSTVPVILYILSILVSKYYPSKFLSICGSLIFVSAISHHLRDANRRGLWFYPFGSTRPLPSLIYILAELILPYLVRLELIDNVIIQNVNITV